MGRYRQSPFDSGVFVLQTTKAAETWLIRDAGELEREICAALSECVPTAAACKRQGRSVSAGASAGASSGASAKRKIVGEEASDDEE